MIRALFSLGSDSTKPRVVRRQSSEPRRVSRRDFLTLGRSPRRADGTWRVTIDAGRCTDCIACTRICGEPALRRSDHDLHVVYSLDMASCTGCGDCETVCAATALGVRREAEPGRGIIELARLSKERCSSCGHTQAGLVDGVCPICRPAGLSQTLRR